MTSYKDAGAAAESLLDQFKGTHLANGSKTWSQMFANAPALSDTLWASDPSYWQTIRTATVDGGKAALLARGPTGMRTWLYDGSAFARPKPHGNFPTLDSASYQAINNFMTFRVRELYTGPSDATSHTTATTASAIIHANQGCTDEPQGGPPQYATCDPLPGTQNPAYTNTVNQLIKELWYAGNVVDHFTTLQTMQTQLFVATGTELPAIDKNLQIPEASDESAAMNWFSLFDGILFLAGDVPEFGPEITIAADAFSSLLSGLPLFSSRRWR